MSVLRGGSYLQRRLTKLYTDTKSSCESVTTVSRPSDDPELISLNLSYRTQKDRLLAWGLDWSDASAAQPNDIDDALAEAGFSDVVAGIMSSIQELLNEAERQQQPDMPKSSPDGLTTGVVKMTWTDQEISRSKSLLGELTLHIDTLYDLSRSRRDMTMSMSSTKLQPSTAHAHLRPHFDKLSKEHTYPAPPDSKSHPTKYTNTPNDFFQKDGNLGFSSMESAIRPLHSHSKTSTGDKNLIADQMFLPLLSSTKEFYIDRNSLSLSSGGNTHTPNPPPYEPIAASANSRILGQLFTSAVPTLLTEGISGTFVPVLVEFSPIPMETQNSLTLPKRWRLQRLSTILLGLISNARVSHLGLLKFLGYFVDMTYSRYAFIYQMPSDIPGFTKQPSGLAEPKPLASLFLTGSDPQDTPVPHLETRFRLAYNLILAVLHLRSQNLVHGNINSNNILIFPGMEVSNNGTVDNFPADFRHPYLSSLMQFDNENNNIPPEPLSLGMYRHPDDRQILSDPSAWAYDLYSLGLVLLEIGLWTPISRLWKMKYDKIIFKTRIENVYIKKLAAKCGSAYLQAVQLCLDAPNFHLSTSPMSDLSLRLPQTYHYPWNDPNQANEWNTFSRNFVYTMSKILFRCSNLDIVAPPPDTDLEESLPPPVSLGPESSPYEEITPQNHRLPNVDPAVPIDISNEDAPFAHQNLPNMKGNSGERKVRKRTLKKWSNIEIPDEHLQIWNTTLMPKLSKLLQKILRDSAESCSATLMVAGESADSAKTTICVTCTNVRKVKATLKEYFDYNKDWDLIVIRGDINRSKVPRRRRKKAKVKSNFTANFVTELNPYYQPKPICGASIGAFRLDEHLPPVSYGGAILVDGEPYGMTVHHMIDSPYDEEEECYSRGPGPATDSVQPLEVQDQDFAYTWCDDVLPEASYPFEISDDEDIDGESVSQSADDSYDDYWISDGYSSDEGGDMDNFDIDDDTASIGDTIGVCPEDEPLIMVTQPALDDIEDGFFPCPEDRDDEHLASHSLGHIHASSGLRRLTRDGIKHEVDWALIKIDPTRMDTTNAVPAVPISYSNPNIHQQGQSTHFKVLTKVARLDELSGSYVQCCGRTSGLQSGRISKAMTLVKLPGRQSFSLSFCVDGNFGVPGDSGAWVFDQHGQVCGHVLAWSEKSQTAYIAPMVILLDDIARTLDAKSVVLPGSEEEIVWQSTMAAAESPRVNFTAAAKKHNLPVPRPLPLELSKLRLNNFDDPSPTRPSSNPPTSSAATVGKDVPASTATTYRKGVAGLMTHPRTIERQLA
ncbi:hypothetical protein LOZ65_001832 [Ophidiomyces ophidiicola]|nr:hypothetical protein LOZ65_001832 [Ophidiomyces ophidiicola]